MTPEPFQVSIPDSDLEDLRNRLVHARWADDFGNADWRYGVERGWFEEMVRYWCDDYDWRAAEREINRMPQFRVVIDGVPIHFVHIRGQGPNPMPLLLVHGWPWTFMDFHGLVGPLTAPAAHGGDAADSFDLVIPSLPGHGFSMPLATTGLDVPRHVDLFTRLMSDVLGYPRFAVGGGDWGAAISNLLAHAHPDKVIGLLATIPFFPGLDLTTVTPQDYAADEQWMLARQSESGPTVVSHFTVQSSDPQTLAYALVDSPVGTAAWLWERRRSWSDCGGDLLAVYDRDFLCTLASIYWLTRTIGTSLRTYWEHARAGGLPFRPLHDRKPVIEVPCGYAIAPKEVMLVPRALVEQATNLKRWSLLPKGGHFSFAEQPALLTGELRDFFRPLRGEEGRPSRRH
ncbi:MAG: epoxide hydrolase [Novosphingobium sp.]|nr:epoxide hydrolase [Novosphingobium sp.]